jgi:hypothetical protein
MEVQDYALVGMLGVLGSASGGGGGQPGTSNHSAVVLPMHPEECTTWEVVLSNSSIVVPAHYDTVRGIVLKCETIQASNAIYVTDEGALVDMALAPSEEGGEGGGEGGGEHWKNKRQYIEQKITVIHCR